LIYVLGGNGFVGSAFIRYLEKQEEEFVNITRENYIDYVDTSCDLFINANGNSKRFLAEKSPLEDFDMNVKNALQTTLHFDIKRYLLISSVDVYHNPSQSLCTREDKTIQPEFLSNYGLSKYLTECVIRKHANDWMIFRVGGMVGENMTKGPVYDIMNDVDLFVNPDSRYQFINTDQVADIVLNTKGKNEIFNVCATSNMPLRRIFYMLGKEPKLNKKPLHKYNVDNWKISEQFRIETTGQILEKFFKEKGIYA